MELKVNIDLEAAVAQALAPEKLQPILDKHIIGAITSAIDDATGYRSTFRTVLKDQLAAAMPHGIEIADVAKLQHVLNEVLRNAVHGQNATALNTALEKAAASVMPDMPATLKLSQLMEDARHGLHVEEREAFYALFEQEYGFSHLYLDRETNKGSRYGSGTSETKKYAADYRLDFDKEGRCYSMKLDGKQVTPGYLPNAVGGFEGTLLALYVGRTRLEFDMNSDGVASAASEQYDYGSRDAEMPIIETHDGIGGAYMSETPGGVFGNRLYWDRRYWCAWDNWSDWANPGLFNAVMDDYGALVPVPRPPAISRTEEMTIDLQLMARRYRHYCDWCRRSGYAALDWADYKQLSAPHYCAGQAPRTILF